MFDLFRSRTRSVRILLGALLMLVAVMLVVTLIPGFGTGELAGPISRQVVAEIGGEPLTALDVQRNIQMQIRGRTIPPELASVFVPQLVDQMITEYALAYQAERMGFQVTEADLALTIQSIFPELFEGGRFIGREFYSAYLAQQNLTIPQFERNLRKQLLLNKLRSLALEGIVITPEEVESEYRRRNEQIRIEYIAFTPERFRAEVNVTQDEIRDHFEKNIERFRLPERRSVEVVAILESEIEKTVTVSEEALRRAYQEEQEIYRIPERVNVRHILLTTTEKPQDEMPAIRAKAEDLLNRIKEGADFAALAREHSEDPGSAQQGGDLGWVARGQTVQAFENAAFTLNPGQISDVVVTEYGFHILQVLKREDARVRPFEEVRIELERDRKRQFVYDRMQELAEQVRATLMKEPDAAQRLARDMNLQYVSAKNHAPGEPFPQVGHSPTLEDAIVVLRRGEVSSIVQPQPDQLAVAVVNDVQEARQATLDEVQEQIRETLLADKLRELVSQRARAAAEEAKASADVRGVARSLGMEWTSTSPFSRTGAADGIGSAALLEEGFDRSIGEVFGPVSGGGDRWFVCRVIEKIPADMSNFAAERDHFQQQLKMEKASVRQELFEEGVRNRLISEGKVKIYREVIDRLVASYRG